MDRDGHPRVVREKIALDLDLGRVPVSALLAEARPPLRAVVVALHGGAATSAYFDAPGQPRLSLLRTGAALGYTVLALDRPGYGGSAGHDGWMASAGQRVDLAYAAVDALLGARARGAGLFLLGHSMGCVLAVQMAADERGAGLLGLEIAGIGRHYQPRAAELLRLGPDRTGSEMGRLIWGADRLYPAYRDLRIYSPAPGYEGDDMRDWRRDLPALAARVRVPVRYSLGDHEGVWESGPAALADVAGLFTASPRVVAQEQAGSGHNLSLGLSALAYHLKVLSFVEECALARENSSDKQGGARGAPIELAGG
jgi:pimeloyl-ACP methyl ester carboxylesterase